MTNNNQGHILVVDDHKTSRIKISFAVKKLGHTVDTAEDGRQALEMLRAQPFDIVLLDIVMPGMDGYQVLEQMKADETLRDISVIVISADQELSSVVRGIELGAEDYLPKTFDAVLLNARINVCMEKKRLRIQQEAFLLHLDLENQRKSEELEQARQIQLSMLPDSPPVLSHLDIAASMKTASEVGGDYYDFFYKANGNLLVAIGDATGHGVGPSLMVSMTKALLSANIETDMLTLLKKLNSTFDRVDLSRKLNMALLLLEISKMRSDCVTVRASGGGIPPIYILQPAGTVNEVLISGLPLGVGFHDGRGFDQTEFTLTSGEAVLLMSDGLTEMFNPAGKFLGYDRLMSALQQIDVPNLGAEEILEHVEKIGDDWAMGHPLHDDVTLVVIKVR